MKPLLAYNKPYSMTEVKFPVFASPKLDGIRCLFNKSGFMLTRNLLPIPNKKIRAKFEGLYANMDGELIVGDPTASDCYNKTQSKVTTIDGDADDVFFFAFDLLDDEMMFEYRLQKLRFNKSTVNFRVVPQQLLYSVMEVNEYENKMVDLGYEGIMLRSPLGLYKHGRSTFKEQYLLKVKRFEDSEGLVLGVLPRMKNNNEQKEDATGKMKRSSHKENKVAMPEAGLFKLRDLKTNVEFECGMGTFSQVERKAIWKSRNHLGGVIVKYRFQPAGVKDKPRFPRAIGFRNKVDL